MKQLPDTVRDRIESVLQGGRTLLMGIGNILRGDDALGPELLEMLRDTGLPLIDAGTTPENQIGSAARCDPETVLLVDAVHMDMEAGSCQVLTRDEILANTGFSTHDQSPALFMELLEETTGAEVLMLAVQPAQLSFGAPMTPEVRETLEMLALFIRSVTSAT